MSDLGINSMSYSEFKKFIINNGLPRTDVDGGELVLTKADALHALKILSNTNIGILGGDVYELESDGYFRPTYDNWYCNRDSHSSKDFAKNSKEIALNYIKNYNEIEGLEFRYVLVIDAEES